MEYDMYKLGIDSVPILGAPEPEPLEPTSISWLRVLYAVEADLSDKPIQADASQQPVDPDALSGLFGELVRSLLTGEPLGDAADVSSPQLPTRQPDAHHRDKVDVDSGPQGISLDIYTGGAK